MNYLDLDDTYCEEKYCTEDTDRIGYKTKLTIN